ncbi:Chromodomain-helicase-DNA-binding protein 7, partial [Fragariocoptes setiger]
ADNAADAAAAAIVVAAAEAAASINIAVQPSGPASSQPPSMVPLHSVQSQQYPQHHHVSAQQQHQQHQQSSVSQYLGSQHPSQAPPPPSAGSWPSPQQSHYATMQSNSAYMTQPVTAGPPPQGHVPSHQQVVLRQASQSSWAPPQSPYTMQPPQYLQGPAPPPVPPLNSGRSQQSQQGSPHPSQQQQQQHHQQQRQAPVSWQQHLPTSQSYYQTPSVAVPSASRTQFPAASNAYMSTNPATASRNTTATGPTPQQPQQQRNPSNSLGTKTGQTLEHGAGTDATAGGASTTPWSTPSPSLYGTPQQQQQSANQSQNNTTSSYYSNSYDTTPLPYHSSHHHSTHHAYQLGPSHTSTLSSLDHANSGFSPATGPSNDSGINPTQYWSSPVQSHLATPTGLPHPPPGLTNVPSNVSSGATNTGLTQQPTHHSLHRQSPAASPLPSTIPSRASNSSQASNAGPPSVRTPDRCPSIGSSSSLAQLEQMVMPHLGNSDGPNGPNSHPSSHRSYTSSPVVGNNTGPSSSGVMPTGATTSGSGGPITSYSSPYDHSGNNDASSSSASNSVATAASYGYSAPPPPPSSSNYGFSSPYDSAPPNSGNHSGADIHKASSLWSESPALLSSLQSPYNLYEPAPPSTGASYSDYSSTIMSASSAAYGQPPLSSISTNDMSQPQSSATTAEVNDPYAIDANTFSDYNEPSASSIKKSTKGRPKKSDGDRAAKKERKPRAPRAPKTPKASSLMSAPIDSQMLPTVTPSVKKRKGKPAYVPDATNSLISSEPPPDIDKPIEGEPSVDEETSPFKQKKDCSNVTEWMEDEPFNPEYCEVDRVISNKIYDDWVPSAEEKVPEESKTNEIDETPMEQPPAPTLDQVTTDDVTIPEQDNLCDDDDQDKLEFRDLDQTEICEQIKAVEEEIMAEEDQELVNNVVPDDYQAPEPLPEQETDELIQNSEEVMVPVEEPPLIEDKAPDQCTTQVKAKPKRVRIRPPRSSRKKKVDNDPPASDAQPNTDVQVTNDTHNQSTIPDAVDIQSTDGVKPGTDPDSKTETPVKEKPKRIRIRESRSSRKKKMPKIALKFLKTKKRKRLGSSDHEASDMEKTPPPSPDNLDGGLQKRRSSRNTKRTKYTDDIDLDFSDSDDDTLPPSKLTNSQSNAASESALMDNTNGSANDESIEMHLTKSDPNVVAAPIEDAMLVVEKIMACRMGQRELEPEEGDPPDAPTHIDIEEFYVKYKNLSYLHCDWRTEEELQREDPRVAQKIQRFKQKKDGLNMTEWMEDEPFNPEYCEVDRILAVKLYEEWVPDEDEKVIDDSKADEIDETPMEQPPAPTLDQVTTDDVTIPEQDNLCDDDDQDKLEFRDLDQTEICEQIKAVEEEIMAEGDQELVDNIVSGENQALEPVTENETDRNQGSDTLTEQEIGKDKDPVSEQEIGESMQTSEEVAIPDKETPLVEENAPEQSTAQVKAKPKKLKRRTVRHYLVKWRGLPYEDSTWELEDDLDQNKIAQFWRFKDPPPRSKWRPVKRPKPECWKKFEESPVYKGNNTLRDYQLEGLSWLTFCWYEGRNCILADEMGLGKTIQSIAFINEIYKHGINGPFLIIVPLSVTGNWAREFETWTDLNVITYHGSSASREMLKEYEMFYRHKDGNRINGIYKFQVMITTFEVIMSDCLDLCEIPWRCCIIDEAHRLKNRNCKLLEGLRLFNMEHRVLLTGTPLQNNVEELFSLLNFLEPVQFASTEQFLAEFGDLKTEDEVEKLKLILKPMMLRRLKDDVEKSLAPKEETIVEVELTNIQKKYYRAILERNFTFLSKGATSNSNVPNLMNTMMELRKCCIHPYLIKGAEEAILYEAKNNTKPGETMNSLQTMINASGKLVLIDKLLPRLRADGHRVLIFSQMVQCLNILEDYITQKRYPFERIDGGVRGNERQQAIDRFSKPGSDRFIFLLCTRAGGLGINLTAADTVIIFDSDWNPQNDLQAQARCHRIGQSKAVKIYRLICRNTYEREMFDKASLKLGLDKAVLQSMNTSQKGSALGQTDASLSKKEVEELLRKGAYGALMDDDNAGDKFCEEDIDQILLRRTQVITIESTEAKGSTFSKATFSASNNRDDIELDDPDFWEKWAKKANLDSDELKSKNDLIVSEPRKRTQTKRFGADESLLDIQCFHRNLKKQELRLAQKAKEDLKRERSMRTEAARSEREERRRSAAQKWSRREEADFYRTVSSFGVDYKRDEQRYDWQKFKTLAKLDKKMDETLDDYYKAFIAMCKKVTSKVEITKGAEKETKDSTPKDPTDGKELKESSPPKTDGDPDVPTEAPNEAHANAATDTPPDAPADAPSDIPADAPTDATADANETSTFEPSNETANDTANETANDADEETDDQEAPKAPQINVHVLTEDRAARCLARIEFLSKIREEILCHPELDERIKKAPSAGELPDWWICGQHDKELLEAAAKHGLTRLDYNIAQDPDLSFGKVIYDRARKLFESPPAPVLVSVCQLQSLLEQNGIEYYKDPELRSDFEEIRCIINELIDGVVYRLEPKNTEDIVEEMCSASKTEMPQKESQSGRDLESEMTEEKSVEPSSIGEESSVDRDSQVASQADDQESQESQEYSVKKENSMDVDPTAELEASQVPETKPTFKDTPKEIDQNAPAITLLSTPQSKRSRLTSFALQSPGLSSAMMPSRFPPMISQPSILTRKSAASLSSHQQPSLLHTPLSDKLFGNRPTSVRLAPACGTSTSRSVDELKVAEMTPVLPDEFPEDFGRNFESGEVLISIHTEVATVNTAGNTPIPLSGAHNQVTAKLRWPKDKTLQTRLEHLVHLVEKNEWPVPRVVPSVPTITIPTPITPLVTVTTSTNNTPSLGATPMSASLSAGEVQPSPSSASDTLLSSKQNKDQPSAQNHLESEGTPDSQQTSSRGQVRGKRGRGRRPKNQMPDRLESKALNDSNSDTAPSSQNDRAKLRNLLSQGSGSQQSSPFDFDPTASSEPPTKPSRETRASERIRGTSSRGSRDSGGISSLLTGGSRSSGYSSKSKGSSSNTNPDPLSTSGSQSLTGDLSAQASLLSAQAIQKNAANLLPQLLNMQLANLKPELRDAILNATAGGHDKSSVNSFLAQLASLMPQAGSVPKLGQTSAGGPPPAHSHAQTGHGTFNPIVAHSGSSSTTGTPSRSSPASTAPDTRRGEDRSSPISMRSSRRSERSATSGSSHEPTPAHASRGSSSRRSHHQMHNAQSAPPTGADVLDLSASLPRNKSSAGDKSSRGDRERGEHNTHHRRKDSSPTRSSRRHRTSAREQPQEPTKDEVHAPDEQQQHSRDHVEDSGKETHTESNDKKDSQGRLTRASKRIGSRIDALALNLQAKKMKLDGSESAPSESGEATPPPPSTSSHAGSQSPPITRRHHQQAPIAHGGQKQSGRSSADVKAPPAAHSSTSFSKLPFGGNESLLLKGLASGTSSLTGLMQQQQQQLQQAQRPSDTQKWASEFIKSAEFKRLLKDNPNLASLAADVETQQQASVSSMPQNTEVFELPDNKKRGRKSGSSSASKSFTDSRSGSTDASSLLRQTMSTSSSSATSASNSSQMLRSTEDIYQQLLRNPMAVLGQGAPASSGQQISQGTLKYVAELTKNPAFANLDPKLIASMVASLGSVGSQQKANPLAALGGLDAFKVPLSSSASALPGSGAASPYGKSSPSPGPTSGSSSGSTSARERKSSSRRSSSLLASQASSSTQQQQQQQQQQTRQQQQQLLQQQQQNLYNASLGMNPLAGQSFGSLNSLNPQVLANLWPMAKMFMDQMGTAGSVPGGSGMNASSSNPSTSTSTSDRHNSRRSSSSTNAAAASANQAAAAAANWQQHQQQSQHQSNAPQANLSNLAAAAAANPFLFGLNYFNMGLSNPLNMFQNLNLASAFGSAGMPTGDPNQSSSSASQSGHNKGNNKDTLITNASPSKSTGAVDGAEKPKVDCAKECPCGVPTIPVPDQWLEVYIVGGFKVWHIIFILIAVIVIMIIVYCCFHRCRIPRTKQEIEADSMRSNLCKKFREYLQQLPVEQITFQEALKKVNDLEEIKAANEDAEGAASGSKKRLGWLKYLGKDDEQKQQQTKAEDKEKDKERVDATNKDDTSNRLLSMFAEPKEHAKDLIKGDSSDIERLLGAELSGASASAATGTCDSKTITTKETIESKEITSNDDEIAKLGYKESDSIKELRERQGRGEKLNKKENKRIAEADKMILRSNKEIALLEKKKQKLKLQQELRLAEEEKARRKQQLKNEKRLAKEEKKLARKSILPPGNVNSDTNEHQTLAKEAFNGEFMSNEGDKLKTKLKTRANKSGQHAKQDMADTGKIISTIEHLDHKEVVKEKLRRKHQHGVNAIEKNAKDSGISHRQQDKVVRDRHHHEARDNRDKQHHRSTPGDTTVQLQHEAAQQQISHEVKKVHSRRKLDEQLLLVRDSPTKTITTRDPYTKTLAEASRMVDVHSSHHGTSQHEHRRVEQNQGANIEASPAAQSRPAEHRKHSSLAATSSARLLAMRMAAEGRQLSAAPNTMTTTRSSRGHHDSVHIIQQVPPSSIDLEPYQKDTQRHRHHEHRTQITLAPNETRINMDSIADNRLRGKSRDSVDKDKHRKQ